MAAKGKQDAWQCLFPSEEGVINHFDSPTFFIFYQEDRVQLGADGILKTSVNDFTAAEKEFSQKRAAFSKQAIAKINDAKYGFYAIDCFWHVVTLENA